MTAKERREELLRLKKMRQNIQKQIFEERYGKPIKDLPSPAELERFLLDDDRVWTKL